MDCSEDKVWLEDIKYLFCDWRMIPRSEMTFNEKINSSTRLVIITTIVISIFSTFAALLFFIVSLVLIIMFYFLLRNLKDYISQFSNESKNVENFVCSRKDKKEKLLHQINNFMRPLKIPNKPEKCVKKTFKYNIVPAC